MRREFDAAVIERMDLPQPPSAELREDLAVLERMNASFGSHALVMDYLGRWLGGLDRFRVLDLCTGGGDLPRRLVEWGRERGKSMEVHAVDFQPGTVEVARELCAPYPEIQVIQGDARTFVGDSPYDVVLCSLALHHFSEDDAVCVLRSARAASGANVLVSDLERGRLAQAAIWALTQFVFRTPMIREDGRISIRRAFSAEEMQQMAKRAGWPACTHRKHAWFRQALSISSTIRAIASSGSA